MKASCFQGRYLAQHINHRRKQGGRQRLRKLGLAERNKPPIKSRI